MVAAILIILLKSLLNDINQIGFKIYAASIMCIMVQPLQIRAQGLSNLLTAADRSAILELVAEYSFRWDAAEAEEFSLLFTEDAECNFYLNGESDPSSELCGRDSMREAAKVRAGYFKKIGLITKHLMPNTVITEIDARTASLRTQALITWQMLAKQPLPQPVQAGYYDSLVVLTADGWKFKRRDVRLNGVFKVKAVYG